MAGKRIVAAGRRPLRRGGMVNPTKTDRTADSVGTSPARVRQINTARNNQLNLEARRAGANASGYMPSGHAPKPIYHGDAPATVIGGSRKPIRNASGTGGKRNNDYLRKVIN